MSTTQHSKADLEMARKIHQAAAANLSLGRKAYISDVKQALCPRMSRQCWTELLTSAHQTGLVRLARADLALDQAKEAASEVRIMNATFHFVAL